MYLAQNPKPKWESTALYFLYRIKQDLGADSQELSSIKSKLLSQYSWTYYGLLLNQQLPVRPISNEPQSTELNEWTVPKLLLPHEQIIWRKTLLLCQNHWHEEALREFKKILT